MKKKIFARLLMLCLLLSACTTEPGDPETTEATAPTETIGENLAKYDPATWPKVEAYTGTPRLESDPERTFYFSASNQDCDFYPGLPYTGSAFSLITKEAYAPEDIAVTLSAKSKYTFTVLNLDDSFQHISENPVGITVGENGQMLSHYLCIQDIDMHTFAQMRSDADFAAEAYNKLVMENLATQDDFKTLMEGYSVPYSEREQQYMDAYFAQGPSALTDYHLYSINITFDRFRDETVEYLDLHLGSETFRIEFGQWRIHSQEPEQLQYKHKGITTDATPVMYAPYDSPYAGGYMGLHEALRFSASEDLALTGLRWQGGGDLEALGAQVLSKSNGSSMDYLWDCKQPLMLDQGTGITLSVYFYSEFLKEYEAGLTGFLYLDYTLVNSGAEYTVAVPCRMNRNHSAWDTYCLAFLDVDVGEYYHYFRDEVFQLQWLNQLPDAWRKEK